MRILELHCDYFQYKVEKKAVKAGFDELTPEAQKQAHRYENVLVVMASVEAGDSQETAAQAAAAVEKNFKEVHASTILVHPYAHLSSNLAKPGDAVKVLDALLTKIQAFAPDAQRSAFGWYKSFEMKCKGHPLAELSKTFSVEAKSGSAADVHGHAPAAGSTVVVGKEQEIVSQSLKSESEVNSRIFIFSPDGKLTPVDQFDFQGHPMLRLFADYEVKKVRVYAQEPPHIRIMKEQQLVSYEPASDSGHFRWLPKGLVMKRLLERYVTQILVDYGAIQVETPIMYDYAHPALEKYLNRFPARQYTVKSDDKQFFLRFAACFGQFLTAHDALISYKQLPFKIYELTHYSFRREQSGELAGLKRLRAFSMPDMHTMTADLSAAQEEFERQYHLCLDWNLEMKIPIETAFRVQRDFFEQNKAWYLRMVQKVGKPMLFEIFNERYAYFVTKFEMNFVDNAGKASGMSTVQIDVENGERFDINYVDSEGKKQHPYILHTSVPGAIERVVYATLEQQARLSGEGQTPQFPLWLSPTQVRIVPISDKQQEACKKLLSDVHWHGVRVDFDDRSETLQKKVRDAEKEWVPFIAVVGDKELESGKLSVRIRSTGKQETLSVKELGDLVRQASLGKPFEVLSLNPLLSKRVQLN